MRIEEYAPLITGALPRGILLNTQGEKFNSMVIGWGHVGVLWSLPVFVAYVRQSRYTKAQLDRTGEFTVSAPLEGGRLSQEVMRVCGSQSGRDVDKGGLFTLLLGKSVGVPAIAEYPVTLECRVLYRQDQCLESIPENIRARFYARGTDAGDFHTAYFAQILEAYTVR